MGLYRVFTGFFGVYRFIGLLEGFILVLYGLAGV